jgi:glycosyltransferase involved in cell wall biosynthesis
MIWSQKIPTVATIHDLAPFHMRDKYDWKRNFYGKVVVKKLAHRQRKIMAISKTTSADIQKFFQVPAEKIQVIHNGIDHARFHPGDRNLSKAYVRDRFGLREPYLLYTARLEHPAKNHLRLVQAFEQLKTNTGLKYDLVLAGADWHGAEEVHQAIASSPAKASIKVLGFVADGDIPDLYRAAEFFVFPSLFEGFGFPPLEAMACGCPVISSNRGALEEVVRGGARIIDPENVPALALAISEVAKSEQERSHLIAKGLAHVKKFDWSVNASETIRVYEESIQRPLLHSTTSPSHQAAIL